jgi:hypothetical protein
MLPLALAIPYLRNYRHAIFTRSFIQLLIIPEPVTGTGPMDNMYNS